MQKKPKTKQKKNQNKWSLPLFISRPPQSQIYLNANRTVRAACPFCQISHCKDDCHMQWVATHSQLHLERSFTLDSGGSGLKCIHHPRASKHEVCGGAFDNEQLWINASGWHSTLKGNLEGPRFGIRSGPGVGARELSRVSRNQCDDYKWIVLQTKRAGGLYQETHHIILKITHN